MSNFNNIVNLIIHNPNRFISRLSVFFNTVPMLSLINEKEVEMNFSGINFYGSTVKIIGRLSGLLGFLSIRDITDIHSKISKHNGISFVNHLNHFDINASRFTHAGDFPVRIFQVSISLRKDLPPVFIEAIRSFCRSYSDVGRDWDYLI